MERQEQPCLCIRVDRHERIILKLCLSAVQPQWKLKMLYKHFFFSCHKLPSGKAGDVWMHTHNFPIQTVLTLGEWLPELDLKFSAKQCWWAQELVFGKELTDPQGIILAVMLVALKDSDKPIEAGKYFKPNSHELCFHGKPKRWLISHWLAQTCPLYRHQIRPKWRKAALSALFFVQNLLLH